MTLLTLLKATTGGGGVAVTYIDSTTTGNTAFASSRAVSVPNGGGSSPLQADDVVAVWLSRWESSNPAVTAPSGFVARTQAVNGSGKINLYLKRLTGADTGTYSFSWTGSMWTTAQAISFRGVDPSADLSTVPLHQVTNSGTSWPAATLNSVGAGMLAWHGYSESNGNPHTAPTTPSFTKDEDNDSDVTAHVAVAAGNYTTSGGSAVASSNNIVSMVHLPEAAGGGTPIAGSDSATLTEGTTGLERQSAVTDSATTTDAAQLSRQSTLTDTLTVTDLAAVGQFFDKAGSDSVTVTDSATVVSVTLASGADSATIAEAVALERQTAITDTAALTEASAIQRDSQSSDSWTLTDAAEIQRSSTATDTATLSEAATVGELAGKNGTDTATVSDAATVTVVSLINATDSAAVSETAVLQRSSDRTDSAALTETASVTSVLAALDFVSATELALVSASVGATDSAAVTDASTVFEPPSITVRPFTGTTARPSTGTTSRPNTGTTERP